MKIEQLIKSLTELEKLKTVERGLNVYLESGCDAILALGGGSAMDCAKVIAARVTNKKSIKRLAGLFRVWRTPAPLFVIPTTSGTGPSRATF